MSITSRRRRRRSSASSNCRKRSRHHNMKAGSNNSALARNQESRPNNFDDRSSLLSPDSNALVSHGGFSNLCRLLLVLTYTKDILRDLRASGWHADFFLSALKARTSNLSDWPILCAMLFMCFNIWVAYSLETVAKSRAFSENSEQMNNFVAAAHTLNCILVIVVPSLAVIWSNSHVISNFVVTLSCLTLCMKLVSYAMVNRKLRDHMVDSATSAWGIPVTSPSVPPSYHSISPLVRMYPSSASGATTTTVVTEDHSKTTKPNCTNRRNRRRRSSSESSTMSTFSATSAPLNEGRVLVHPSNTLAYPNNITVTNIMYFIAIPTLVYQKRFPRTDGIRWGWLCMRVLELVFCSALLLTIAQQYVAPMTEGAIQPLTSMEALHGTELLLSLAIPQIKVWLLIFYCFFHLYMNILAEVLCYANRTFYKDWWNARNLEQFWRKWNIPVHAFIKHHIYIPLAIERGYNSKHVMLFCFFVSAVAHELVFSVSFRSFNIWAFLGMMAQVPLVAITRGSHILGTPYLGNTVFWLSIVIGQPLGIIMYYYDYCKRNDLITYNVV